MRASSAFSARRGTTRPRIASAEMMPSKSFTGTCLKRAPCTAARKVDRPGVFGHAGSRGQARDQRIEALALEAVLHEGCRVGDLAEAQAGPFEKPGYLLHPWPRPQEADHLVAAREQGPHRSPADGTAAAEDEHPPRADGWLSLHLCCFVRHQRPRYWNEVCLSPADEAHRLSLFRERGDGLRELRAGRRPSSGWRALCCCALLRLAGCVSRH